MNPPRAIRLLFRLCVAAALCAAAFSAEAVAEGERWPGRHDGDYRVIEAEAVADHLQIALTAALLRLRGADPAAVTRDLSFAGSEIIEPVPGGLEDFSLLGLKIVHAEPGGVVDNVHRYGAALYFVGPSGQRDVLRLQIAYGAEDGKTRFTEGRWTPIYTANPRTEVILVPRSERGALSEGLESYDHLYWWALEHGLRINDPATVPEGEQSYLALVFVKDRLAPGARLIAGLSAAPDELASGESSRYLAYGPWIAGVVPARFALDGETPFYLTVGYALDGSKTPPVIAAHRLGGEP